MKSRVKKKLKLSKKSQNKIVWLKKNTLGQFLNFLVNLSQNAMKIRFLNFVK